jgi:hypothetical protein
LPLTRVALRQRLKRDTLNNLLEQEQEGATCV